MENCSFGKEVGSQQEGGYSFKNLHFSYNLMLTKDYGCQAYIDDGQVDGQIDDYPAYI